MKKPVTILFITIFFISLVSFGYGYSQTCEFLCEMGIKFYQQGRYTEALQEFQKALMIQPTYQPALKYIQMMEQMQVSSTDQREKTIRKMLNIIETERGVMVREEAYPAAAPLYPVPKITKTPVLLESKPSPAKVVSFKILKLDESLSKVYQPIEIEQGKGVIIVGKDIQRFLVVEPNILKVEKKSADELLVTGNDIGYTYLHIWDKVSRWTLELLTVFAHPEGQTLEEKMRLEEERAKDFKLRYSLDWSAYEKGRRINTLKRSSYSYVHNLGLDGETPYGNLDASVAMNRMQTRTDVGHYTLGLSNGHIGPFKGFALRGFDFFDWPPDFSNLAFPGVALRGGMFTSPAFNQKLNYTVFYGRENLAGYGSLSPTLTKTKESFLEGFNLNYSPLKRENYKFTLVRGWGKDRENNLNTYAYDLSNLWNFNRWGLGYEIAYDSETLAHIFNTHYIQPKLNLGLELRNINKNFLSITGSSGRQGELGSLLNLSYKPIDKLEMNSSLDVYQDRLYPAKDNDNRLNEDLNCNSVYRINSLTSLRLNYRLNNELGRISQYRYQNVDMGLSRTFKFIKDIHVSTIYYHQKNNNFSSPSSDYINDRLYAGLRFSLVGDLYYYLNKELNWLKETCTGSQSQPNALETGLDWSGQIDKTPFYGSLRFTFRDEEDALSNLSFLSGEDYIEGYSELSYRPKSDVQIYGSCRMRNVWPDNPSVTKRIEASFNSGIRYLWDTGLKWESVGNIEGYVFKDLNSDGMRQKDEPPLKGIKVWLGKDKSQVTDIFGYYKFKGIRGRKAYVNLDTSTIPAGFILTVPLTQAVSIEHNRLARVDFGVTSRSEISGFVFEDVDANGEYNKKDKGISSAVITLEDGSKSLTDDSGRYSFPRVSPGEHTITLDLNSLPVYYLPKKALIKKITLFEGVTYYYNIPLKRIKE